MKDFFSEAVIKDFFSEAATRDDVLWKKLFVKFRNIYRKTPLLELLLNLTLLKRDSSTGVFLWILQNL